MRSVMLAIVGLLLVVGVVAFIFWPFGSQMSQTSVIDKVAEGQATFARHLDLGLIYERHGLFDKAQAEYQQAITSEQAEISSAAKQGLERVLQRQNEPIPRLQSATRTFVYWTGENLLRLVIVLAVVWLIWFLLVRLPRRPGYLLLPFEDYTQNKSGKALHALVNQALQEAKHTHMRQKEALLRVSETLELPLITMLSAEQDALDSALTALDSFSVGGIDLPLGNMLLAIRRWASSREHVFTGALFQHGSTLKLTAEIRKANTGQVMQAWELSTSTGEQSVDKKVGALAEELAFRLLSALCPELEARTWRSLQLYTNGLRESQRYGREVIDQSVLENATRLLEEAVALDPGYASAHYLLGLVYGDLGRYDRARDAFRAAIAADDRLRVEATYNLGLAFYHEFQDWANDEAIARFTEVQEALAEDRRDGRWKLLLALAHCGLASAHAQRVKSAAKGRALKANEDLLARVERHSHTALELAGDKDEVRAATHNALGVAHLKSGQVDKAIAELEAAIQARPGYPVAYVYLARAYADAQPDKAIRWLKRGLRWRPDYAYAHFWLGKIYAKQGETEAAKEAYTLAQGIPDARNSLGEILAAQGEYEEALAEFHRVVRLNRRHARAWRNLVWWTLEAGKLDESTLREATGWARRALELDRGTPYEWLSHDALGRVLFHRGRLDQAEDAFLASISVQGGDKQIQNRYHLACLYRKQGHPEKAKEALAEALNLPERGYWREKAVASMKELQQEAT